MMQAREASLGDVGAVVRLAALMYESIGQRTGEHWRVAAAAEITARLGDDVVGFVVDDDTGRVVSSGIGVTTHRMPSPANLAARFGYIQWVATEPQWRGCGCARAVVTALIDWFGARQVPVIELHATPDGEPLYRSLGFDNADNPGLRLLPVGLPNQGGR